MGLFEQQLEVISSLPRRVDTCCLPLQRIRTQTIDLLVRCNIGEFANVAAETDLFHERNEAIRGVVQMLEQVRQALIDLDKDHFLLQGALDELINQIDALDYSAQ